MIDGVHGLCRQRFQRTLPSRHQRPGVCYSPASAGCQPLLQTACLGPWPAVLPVRQSAHQEVQPAARQRRHLLSPPGRVHGPPLQTDAGPPALQSLFLASQSNLCLPMQPAHHRSRVATLRPNPCRGRRACPRPNSVPLGFQHFDLSSRQQIGRQLSQPPPVSRPLQRVRQRRLTWSAQPKQPWPVP